MPVLLKRSFLSLWIALRLRSAPNSPTYADSLLVSPLGRRVIRLATLRSSVSPITLSLAKILSLWMKRARQLRRTMTYSTSSALCPSKTNFMSSMVSKPVPSRTEIALRKLGYRLLVSKFNNESKTTPLAKSASTFLQSLVTKKLNLRRRRHAWPLSSSGSPRSLVISSMQDWLQAKPRASVSMRYAVRNFLS